MLRRILIVSACAGATFLAPATAHAAVSPADDHVGILSSASTTTTSSASTNAGRTSSASVSRRAPLGGLLGGLIGGLIG